MEEMCQWMILNSGHHAPPLLLRRTFFFADCRRRSLSLAAAVWPASWVILSNTMGEEGSA